MSLRSELGEKGLVEPLSEATPEEGLQLPNSGRPAQPWKEGNVSPGYRFGPRWAGAAEAWLHAWLDDSSGFGRRFAWLERCTDHVTVFFFYLACRRTECLNWPDMGIVFDCPFLDVWNSQRGGWGWWGRWRRSYQRGEGRPHHLGVWKADDPEMTTGFGDGVGQWGVDLLSKG